jgi:tRNA dimethylallyltransferase
VVVALIGPTASGKTDAALGIADAADVQLVSVDSAMVYRRMDIGTAKPDAATLECYPHALVDIAEPQDPYSAARFVRDADAAVSAALAAGRTPLLVGGTMLYFRAFRDGMGELPEADPKLRAEIAARAAEQGWPALHAVLGREDAKAAAGIDPHNGRRIQRALEVLRLTGRSITDWWQESAMPARQRHRCRLVQIAILPPDRAALHQRIEARLAAMLRRGFLDEVRALREEPGLDLGLPSMRSVGYAQAWRHLGGEYEHAEMALRIAAATRQVAKRQLTWLRRWPELRVARSGAEAAAIAVEAIA